MSEITKLSYLRLMDESDLEEVYGIEQKSYDYPWSMNGFVKSLDQGLNYVFCNAEGQILGYCCILPVLDEATILNVCVAPKYQHNGIAKAGLLKVLDNLRSSDYKIVFLEVRESNLAAQSLYKKLGFNEDGIRKGYYRSQAWDDKLQMLVDEKEDAVLMSYSFT